MTPTPSADAVAGIAYDRAWRWRKNLPDRHGQRLRVIARGTMNSALIEFDDGVRHVVSRFAFRKIPAAHLTGAKP